MNFSKIFSQEELDGLPEAPTEPIIPISSQLSSHFSNYTKQARPEYTVKTSDENSYKLIFTPSSSPLPATPTKKKSPKKRKRYIFTKPKKKKKMSLEDEISREITEKLFSKGLDSDASDETIILDDVDDIPNVHDIPNVDDIPKLTAFSLSSFHTRNDQEISNDQEKPPELGKLLISHEMLMGSGIAIKTEPDEDNVNVSDNALELPKYCLPNISVKQEPKDLESETDTADEGTALIPAITSVFPASEVIKPSGSLPLSLSEKNIASESLETVRIPKQTARKRTAPRVRTSPKSKKKKSNSRFKVNNIIDETDDLLLSNNQISMLDNNIASPLDMYTPSKKSSRPLKNNKISDINSILETIMEVSKSPIVDVSTDSSTILENQNKQNFKKSKSKKKAASKIKRNTALGDNLLLMQQDNRIESTQELQYSSVPNETLVHQKESSNVQNSNLTIHQTLLNSPSAVLESIFEKHSIKVKSPKKKITKRKKNKANLVFSSELGGNEFFIPSVKNLPTEENPMLTSDQVKELELDESPFAPAIAKNNKKSSSKKKCRVKKFGPKNQTNKAILSLKDLEESVSQLDSLSNIQENTKTTLKGLEKNINQSSKSPSDSEEIVVDGSDFEDKSISYSTLENEHKVNYMVTPVTNENLINAEVNVQVSKKLSAKRKKSRKSPRKRFYKKKKISKSKRHTQFNDETIPGFAENNDQLHTGSNSSLYHSQDNETDFVSKQINDSSVENTSKIVRRKRKNSMDRLLESAVFNDKGFIIDSAILKDTSADSEKNCFINSDVFSTSSRPTFGNLSRSKDETASLTNTTVGFFDGKNQNVSLFSHKKQSNTNRTNLLTDSAVDSLKMVTIKEEPEDLAICNNNSSFPPSNLKNSTESVSFANTHKNKNSSVSSNLGNSKLSLSSIPNDRKSINKNLKKEICSDNDDPAKEGANISKTKPKSRKDPMLSRLVDTDYINPTEILLSTRSETKRVRSELQLCSESPAKPKKSRSKKQNKPKSPKTKHSTVSESNDIAKEINDANFNISVTIKKEIYDEYNKLPEDSGLIVQKTPQVLLHNILHDSTFSAPSSSTSTLNAFVNTSSSKTDISVTNSNRSITSENSNNDSMNNNLILKTIKKEKIDTSEGNKTLSIGIAQDLSKDIEISRNKTLNENITSFTFGTEKLFESPIVMNTEYLNKVGESILESCSDDINHRIHSENLTDLIRQSEIIDITTPEKVKNIDNSLDFHQNYNNKSIEIDHFNAIEQNRNFYKVSNYLSNTKMPINLTENKTHAFADPIICDSTSKSDGLDVSVPPRFSTPLSSDILNRVTDSISPWTANENSSDSFQTHSSSVSLSYSYDCNKAENLSNFEKNINLFFKFLHPGDPTLNSYKLKRQEKEKKYKRSNPSSINLSYEEVASKMRYFAVSQIGRIKDEGDVNELKDYPLFEEEIGCFHRILGVVPSQKKISMGNRVNLNQMANKQNQVVDQSCVTFRKSIPLKSLSEQAIYQNSSTINLTHLLDQTLEDNENWNNLQNFPVFDDKIKSGLKENFNSFESVSEKLPKLSSNYDTRELAINQLTPEIFGSLSPVSTVEDKTLVANNISLSNPPMPLDLFSKIATFLSAQVDKTKNVSNNLLNINNKDCESDNQFKEQSTFHLDTSKNNSIEEDKLKSDLSKDSGSSNIKHGILLENQQEPNDSPKHSLNSKIESPSLHSNTEILNCLPNLSAEMLKNMIQTANFLLNQTQNTGTVNEIISEPLKTDNAILKIDATDITNTKGNLKESISTVGNRATIDNVSKDFQSEIGTPAFSKETMQNAELLTSVENNVLEDKRLNSVKETEVCKDGIAIIDIKSKEKSFDELEPQKMSSTEEKGILNLTNLIESANNNVIDIQSLENLQKCKQLSSNNNYSNKSELRELHPSEGIELQNEQGNFSEVQKSIATINIDSNKDLDIISHVAADNSETKSNVSISDNVLNLIDMPKTELLKILSTVSNLSSAKVEHNSEEKPIENFDQNCQNILNNSIPQHMNYNENAYAEKSNIGYVQYPVYNYSPYFKPPIVHEYGHKSISESNLNNSEASNYSSNLKDAVTNNDSSDSDMGNDAEFLPESSSVNDDAENQCTKNTVNDTLDESDKSPLNEPTYVSKWERIMERKALEVTTESKQNEHLLKDYFSVSEKISQGTLKKSSPRKLENKSVKKVSVENYLSKRSLLDGKKYIQSSSRQNSNSKLENKHDSGIRKDLPIEKNLKNLDSISSKTKCDYQDDQSKKCEKSIYSVTKSLSPSKKRTKNKYFSNFKDSDELFTPDKIIKKPDKKTEVSSTLSVKDKNSNIYGRVTNRGSFLTNSLNEKPKSKTTRVKKSVTKFQESVFSDDFHSMVNTPEIELAPVTATIPKQVYSLYEESSNTSVDRYSFEAMPHQRNSMSNSEYSLSPESNFASPVSDFFHNSEPAYSKFSSQTILPHRQNTNIVSDPRLKPQYSNISGLSENVAKILSAANMDLAMPALRSPSAINSPFISSSTNNLNPLLLSSATSNLAHNVNQKTKRQSRCICLPPRHMKEAVGHSVFETLSVLLLILEWNVDWLFQQRKNPAPPPISKSVKKVINSYECFENYYNTYFPLLLLETWQRIYVSWNHLHTASPYLCEIMSYVQEATSIKVVCETIFSTNDSDRGLFPEEGNIIMVKFGTKSKGGIKILGYVTHVSVRAVNPSIDSQSKCYQLLKCSPGDHLQLLQMTFIGAYTSDDFDTKLPIRVHVLCNVKTNLKQNDALLKVKNTPLSKNILNPLEGELRVVNMVSRSENSEENIQTCVKDIIKGILSPHPIPIITIVKSFPSSDRLSVLPPLIQRMKNSYDTKVLLCARTTKGLIDIGLNLDEHNINFVITGKRADVPLKLKRYLVEDLAVAQALNEQLLDDNLQDSLCRENLKQESLLNAKKAILHRSDVILSLIKNCHDDYLEQAFGEDRISQMCCVLDEANLCTEPEILIPVMFGISKIILIGDIDVLAKVCSKTAASYGYNKSLFHRAYELDSILE